MTFNNSLFAAVSIAISYLGKWFCREAANTIQRVTISLGSMHRLFRDIFGFHWSWFGATLKPWTTVCGPGGVRTVQYGHEISNVSYGTTSNQLWCVDLCLSHHKNQLDFMFMILHWCLKLNVACWGDSFSASYSPPLSLN